MRLIYEGLAGIMTEYMKEIRKFVGHRPVIQCGASVIVENGNGEILLQLRADNKCWGYAGGAVEVDERAEDAARRELLEETGLRAIDLVLFGVFSGAEMHYIYPNGDEVSNIDIVYICREYEGELKADMSEVTQLRFYPIDALPSDISPPTRPVIHAYLETRRENNI